MATNSTCFIAGTNILTDDGQVAIETIKKGDMVWAENLESGEKDLKEVVQTFVGTVSVLYHVYIENEEIIATENHPFWTEERGWVGAAYLQGGDTVRLNNGQHRTVKIVVKFVLERPVYVYNFEVANFHTYYVSNISILVHNKQAIWDPEEAIRSIASLLEGTGQLKDLRHSGKTLANVNMEDLLSKSPKELLRMLKNGEINGRTLTQIKKSVSRQRPWWRERMLMNKEILLEMKYRLCDSKEWINKPIFLEEYFDFSVLDEYESEEEMNKEELDVDSVPIHNELIDYFDMEKENISDISLTISNLLNGKIIIFLQTFWNNQSNWILERKDFIVNKLDNHEIIIRTIVPPSESKITENNYEIIRFLVLEDSIDCWYHGFIHDHPDGSQSETCIGKKGPISRI